MTLTKNKFDEQFIDEYIKTVEKNAKCKRSLKKRYLEELKESINSYFEQHPDVTEEEFLAKFKSPEQAAKRFVNYTASDDSVKRFKRWAKIITVILAIIAVCIVTLIFYDQYIIFYSNVTREVKLPPIGF